MRSGTPPTLRRILAAALLALVVGLGVVSLLAGFSAGGPVRLLQQIALAGAGVVVIGGGAILLAQRMAGWREPASEREFDEIVERSERLAREGVSGAGDDDLDDPFDEDEDDLGFDVHDPDDFEALVRSALDDLPLAFHRALEQVAVVVSDGGRRRRAYGLYHGDGVSRDEVPDRIVIYRDTLLRDFGHDADLLRAQVTRTVRHELAHHLGWDESGVSGLGL